MPPPPQSYQPQGMRPGYTPPPPPPPQNYYNKPPSYTVPVNKNYVPQPPYEGMVPPYENRGYYQPPPPPPQPLPPRANYPASYPNYPPPPYQYPSTPTPSQDELIAETIQILLYLQRSPNAPDQAQMKARANQCLQIPSVKSAV